MKTPQIKFGIVGIPAPQPRPKATLRHGKVFIYTPPTAAEWRQRVRLAAVGAIIPKGVVLPLSGPLKLTTSFYLWRPKAHFNSNGTLRADAPNWCPHKPDFDNLAKAVADEMTECGFWHDDGQIVFSIITKRYSHFNGECGCGVTVEILPE